MTLEELLQKTSLGPLAELAIAGEGSGTVPPDNYGKLLLRFNSTFTALFSRFPLQLMELELEVVEGIRTYYLRPEFALLSGSLEPYKYIMDTIDNQFLGNVLMVTGVYNSEHEDLPLNDRHNELSWFTPSYDSVQFDYAVTGEHYTIEYRARHPEIPLNTTPVEAATMEVWLPFQLEEAFLKHVAGNIYSAMSSQEALTKGQLLLAEYESICAYHEDRNTFHEAVSQTNYKPALRGWP